MPKPQTDKYGNTKLHYLIEAGVSPKDISQFINSCNPTLLCAMSTTVNHYGFTPLQLLTNHELYSENERREIRALIFPIMINASKLPPIQSKILFKKLLKPYKSTASDALKLNLMVASEIISSVRSTLQASSTHPELNDEEECVKSFISSRMENIRKSRTASPSPDLLISLHHDVTTNILPHSIGNCSEFTKVSLYYSLDKLHVKRTEKFIINNGDHAFLVINRIPGSDDNDFKTWGEDAVIIDAWGGDAYPAFDAENHLKDYHHYQIPSGEQYYPHLNILIPYQSHHHKLLSKVSITLQPLEELPDQSTFFNSVKSLFNGTLFSLAKSDPETTRLEQQDRLIARMV